MVLSSDEKKFGGHERVDLAGKYFTTPMEWNGRKNWLQASGCHLVSIIDPLTLSRFIRHLVLSWFLLLISRNRELKQRVMTSHEQQEGR